MEQEDFRSEVRQTLRRIEENINAVETRVRADHDILTRLSQSFTGFGDTIGTNRERIADHEKRIRVLERVAFGMLAVILVAQFIIGKIMK